MNRPFVTASAIFLSCLFGGARGAFAQFTVIDQTRSVSTTASASSWTPQNQGENSATSGVFNEPVSAMSGGNSGPPTNLEVFTSSSASQNSTVASDNISGSEGLSVTCEISGSPGTTNATANSSYVVDFSVAVPTQVTFQFGGTSPTGQHEGPQDMLTTTQELAAGSQIIYNNSYTAASSDSGYGYSLDGATVMPLTPPILQPGNTYTYTVSISDTFPGNDITGSVTMNDSETFGLTGVALPEPAGLSMLAVAAVASLIRRRRPANPPPHTAAQSASAAQIQMPGWSA